MRNISILLALALSAFLTAESFSMGSRRPAPTKPEPVPPVVVEVPVPQPQIPYQPTKVSFSYVLTGFSQAQQQRMAEIFADTQIIVSTDEFREKVYGQYYKGKKGFVDNDGHTNEQVYEKLMAGSELGSLPDNIWNLPIALERGGRGTLGWTYPSTTQIWFNSRYFDGREDSGLSGTICHEYAHKVGFGHAYKSTASRPYSVPYAVGTICSLLYVEFQKKKVKN